MEPERLTLRGAGLDLAADTAGPADGPTILFLHGSGQTRQKVIAFMDSAPDGFATLEEAADAVAQHRCDGPNPFEQPARSLRLPTLLLRGGRSQIVSEASVREFHEWVPHAEYVDIAGAHHMVAGDANDAFNAAVFSFIDRQGGAGGAPSR